MSNGELASGGNPPPLPRPHKSIFELLNDEGPIQPAAQVYRWLLLLDTAVIVANNLRTFDHGSGEALNPLINSLQAGINGLAPQVALIRGA